MILLDTCTLLWLAVDAGRLPEVVQRRIERCPPQERYVSAVTALEVGLKVATGKVRLPHSPRLWFQRTCAARGLTVLPITWSIAVRATELPWHHRDPADRLLLATALEHQLTLFSPDQHVRAYTEVDTQW